jgi:hypothetical protein
MRTVAVKNSRPRQLTITRTFLLGKLDGGLQAIQLERYYGASNQRDTTQWSFPTNTAFNLGCQQNLQFNVFHVQFNIVDLSTRTSKNK